MKHKIKELKQTEELKLSTMDFDNVKCPECQGAINNVWFEGFDWIKKVAFFIAQCWSGHLDKPSKYHMFLIRVPIEAEVDLGKVEEKP